MYCYCIKTRRMRLVLKHRLINKFINKAIGLKGAIAIDGGECKSKERLFYSCLIQVRNAELTYCW